jgi:hypothetical protein
MVLVAASADPTVVGDRGRTRPKRQRRSLLVAVAVASLAAGAAWATVPAGRGRAAAATRAGSLTVSVVTPPVRHGRTGTGTRTGQAVSTIEPQHAQASHPAGVVHAPIPAPATPTPPAAATPSAPASPATPAPPAPPATPSAPATPAAPSAASTPSNPAANIPPSPNFLDVCSGSAVDESAACTQAALAAIDAARADEGLGPMVLPTDWASLTPAQQLFVATNLERTARGLPPIAGLDPALDQAAAAGAAGGTDPSPPAGYPYQLWTANWAGALGNPLEAVYLWMYDDGPGSANVDCPQAGAPGCWGHRDDILASISGPDTAMGVAVDATGWEGSPAWAELLVQAQQPGSLTFTWSAVAVDLPPSER